MPGTTLWGGEKSSKQERARKLGPTLMLAESYRLISFGTHTARPRRMA